MEPYREIRAPQTTRLPPITVRTANLPGADQHGRFSRMTSAVDGMSTIPETHDVDVMTTSHPADEALLSGTAPAPSSPSMLRRLTTKLRSPNPLRSSTVKKSSIPVSPFRSIRRAAGKDYLNLGPNEEDDFVAVDISSLGGLGFELNEMQPPSSSRWIDQDTSYNSPHTTDDKPEFRSNITQIHSTITRRKTIGEGLVVGAQLKRDPSKLAANGLSRNMSRVEAVQQTETVRDIGQNLAQERNMIVALSEPVDISSLEGASAHTRRSQTFENMMTSRTWSVEDNPQSYFFPKDPNVPNWKPFSMSGWYIMALMIGALLLAGSQEYLCQVSFQKEKINSGILDFDEVSEVSVGNFFTWKYLPTMVTIIYAVLFSIMDFDIRRLEPYYQLSQEKGSPAAESLNLDHLTMFQYFVPFKALRLKQYTVAFSTIGNIIASTIAPALQNPSVNFEPNPKCTPQGCVDGAKKNVVLIDPIWSRLLTASYVVVALILLNLFILLRRKSGLLSDPKGIAGIASMATKSHILQDFKNTDLATRGEIHKKLAHRRYILYQSSIYQGQWNAQSEPEIESEKSLGTPHPLMLRRFGAGIPFVAIQVICLVLVPVITLTPANIVPNKLPWLPILVATVLKLIWTTFESDVRMMEPFYQLSKGNATPENSLTLDYQATIYGYMPFKAAFNRHWLVALVGLCSVALDVLSVTVSSFSVPTNIFIQPGERHQDLSSEDETSISFTASFVLSVVILLFVIIVTILVYIRRGHPFLPREPSTIAAILAFIYSSKMLDDFIDTERLTNEQMEKRLMAIGKRYGLAWFRGRDGQVHCAIDEEPMTSRYYHGKPYHNAVSGPLASHDTFYSV